MLNQNLEIENAKGTLQSIVTQLQDAAARKEDYVAPTRDLQFRTQINEGEDNQPQIVMERKNGVPTKILSTNDVAFQQVATKADLDIRTARRLRDDYPAHLDGLMNDIWQKENKGVMVRSFTDQRDPERGIARAFLSSSFKTFDNEHFMAAALPQLIESEARWKVVNATLTERRLYLRLRSLAHEGEAAVGDVVGLGLLGSNSETGMGSVALQQLLWTLACLNGMETQNKMRSTHVQSARGEDHYGLLTDEAKEADTNALSLKLRDITGSFGSRESFDAALEQMRNAHGDKVSAGPADAVNALCGVLQLPKAANAKVLDGLMSTLGQVGFNTGSISRATLVNSVTAVGNAESTGPDEVQDWMKLGSRVLNLSPSSWKQVAEAEPVAVAA